MLYCFYCQRDNTHFHVLTIIPLHKRRSNFKIEKPHTKFTVTNRALNYDRDLNSAVRWRSGRTCVRSPWRQHPFHIGAFG